MDSNSYLQVDVDIKYNATPHTVAKRSIQVIEAFNYFVLLIVTMVILFFLYTCCIIGKAKKIYHQHFQEHCHIHPDYNRNEMERQANSEFLNDRNIDQTADCHYPECHHSHLMGDHHDCHGDAACHGTVGDGGDGHVDNGGFCGADVVVLTLI